MYCYHIICSLEEDVPVNVRASPEQNKEQCTLQ